MGFKILFESLDAPGIVDTLEAATWGRTEIRFGDRVVSELVEKDNRIRQGVYGNILQLAEWIVESWPRLFYERIKVQRETDEWYDWRGYHSARTGMRGQAFPDITISAAGGDIYEVSAMADSGFLAPGIRVSFQRTDKIFVRTEELREALAEVVRTAFDRLGKLSSPRIQNLKTRWEKVSANKDFEILGRLRASDYDALTPEDKEAISVVKKRKDSDLVFSLAETLAVASIRERLSEAMKIAEGLPKGSPKTEKWSVFHHGEWTRYGRPWRTGHEAASVFRKRFKLSDDYVPRAELSDLFELALGWKKSAQVCAMPETGSGLDTIQVRRLEEMPLVWTRHRTDESRRFRTAKAVYYFMFSRPNVGCAMIDTHSLPESSEANAFAAELLAPVAALKASGKSLDSWDNDAVAEQAKKLAVETTLVYHQVHNYLDTE